MRLRLVCSLLILAGFSGCGTLPVTTPPSKLTPAAITHTYNGTASVGDFLTITLNTTALTMTYNNLSNGDSGTFPYTVNADGSYTLADPNGNLLSAYEIPGYALLIQAAKAGPDHNTPAIVTAVNRAPSREHLLRQQLQLHPVPHPVRRSGCGTVTLAGTTGTNSSYWPYGYFSQGSGGAFNASSMDFSGLTEDPSGTFMSGVVAGTGGGTDTIFGTASGFLIVDSPSGSIIGLPKAATSAFDPTVAGTYNGVFYEKANVTMGAGSNVETGTPSTGQATVVVTAAANITVTDSSGNTIINATLTPVANSSFIYRRPWSTDGSV